jgi:GRF zinc finger
VLMLLSIFCRNRTNTHTSTIPHGQPNYIPPPRYHCRRCRSTDLSYRIVQRGNPNGHVGRPYYVCKNPHLPDVTRPDAGQYISGWVTWADNEGVTPGNPPCYCLPISRQDTVGEGMFNAGRHFYTCSTGACDYFSWVQG